MFFGKASIQEKAQCVFWFRKTKSSINIQCKFRRCYGSNPSGAKSLNQWCEMFKETGSVKDLPRKRQAERYEATVELNTW
ncbi:hypothetical protein TNCV_1823271 [Trichonephila clavipes]|nr:hypothetical protein TNCV_1823271 [Trichonephila clavipes]